MHLDAVSIRKPAMTMIDRAVRLLMRARFLLGVALASNRSKRAHART
jgi:hypothetical protein